MFIIKTDEPVAEEREPIFSIDGTEYTIPKVVGGELALEAMDRARREPDAAVTAWCVETLLGKDGWRALRNVKGLDPKIVSGIMEVCRERIFGAVEAEGKD